MDWFSTLTGLASDRPLDVRRGTRLDGESLFFPRIGKRLVSGRLTMPSLAELPPPPSGPSRMMVSEVVQDIMTLHADPANADAVFQVASQFNLLEMVGPEVTPDDGIARYAYDHTQGPACAIACAAGTIYRNHLVPIGQQVGQSSDRQLDMLADLGAALGNEAGRLWTMQNGYVLAHKGALSAVGHRIATSDRATLQGLLRVGVQADTQVTLSGARHLVTQVYASALPIAYNPYAVGEWEPFARLVLETAYLATFAVAAARGAKRVYLTRLGGGAFGNPASWITAAIGQALDVWRSADMEVFLVSYGCADPENHALLTK
jgi:hypothetical protein